LDNLYEKLRAQLTALADSLPEFQRDRKYVELFDEFVREYEFGLALETICDFLLEPNVPPVGKAVLSQVAQLHALMGVSDDCLERLEQKVNSINRRQI
jgi:hypothetical protein